MNAHGVASLPELRRLYGLLPEQSLASANCIGITARSLRCHHSS